MTYNDESSLASARTHWGPGSRPHPSSLSNRWHLRCAGWRWPWRGADEWGCAPGPPLSPVLPLLTQFSHVPREGAATYSPLCGWGNWHREESSKLSRITQGKVSGLQIHFAFQGALCEEGDSLREKDPRGPPHHRPLVAFGEGPSPRGHRVCPSVHSQVQRGCRLLPGHCDSQLLSPFWGWWLARGPSDALCWLLGVCPAPLPPPRLSLSLVQAGSFVTISSVLWPRLVSGHLTPPWRPAPTGHLLVP